MELFPRDLVETRDGVQVKFGFVCSRQFRPLSNENDCTPNKYITCEVRLRKPACSRVALQRVFHSDFILSYHRPFGGGSRIPPLYFLCTVVYKTIENDALHSS